MKHKQRNFRKVSIDVWCAFKARCAELRIKIYTAQEEALLLWLDKHKKGE